MPALHGIVNSITVNIPLLQYSVSVLKVRLYQYTLFLYNLYSLTSINNLIKHIEDDHKENIDKEQLNFNTYDDFLSWKKDEESRTKTSYVQKCASRTCDDIQLWYFYCNRSGVYRTKSDGIRTLKTQGSSKLGEFCTAHMKVQKSKLTNKITVQYVSTHHNHNPDTDIQHLRIPEDLKQSIAAKLIQGVSMTKILDDIRDNVAENGLQREHLTTRQDIRNISRQYNIEGVEKHANDHTSIAAWVEEMKQMEFNPVVTLKQQGTAIEEEGVRQDDFLLAVQTHFQLEMMKAFGNNIICVDATHGTNLYDFLLVTLMVVDDFGEGIPVAWAIMTREDHHMLSFFLKALIKRTGLLQPAVFMSDDANQYWNSWSQVYGNNRTKKLLCAWHVDRAWRKAIQEHLPDTDARINIYHHLRVILMEQQSETFQFLLQKFLSMLTDSHPDFYAYFLKQYAGRAEQWAACHRKSKFINTNMYLESFHRLLKVVYFEGKQNRRLDHLVNILLRVVRDKAFERFQKLHKGKNTHRMSEIQRRHKLGIEVIKRQIPHEISQSSWNVKSQQEPDKEYTVNVVLESCQCNLRCSQCNACIHMYTCSCVDSAIHTTVCKHMHGVQMLRNGDSLKGSNELELQQKDVNDSLGHDCEVVGQIQAAEKVSDPRYLGEILQTSYSLDEQRKKALNKLAELQSLILSTNSADAIVETTKHISNAVGVMKVLENQTPPLYGKDQQMLYQISNSVISRLKRRNHRQ